MVQHMAPAREKPYAVLPVGMFCNRELQRAKPGDEVEFQTGWRREKRRIVQMCRFRVNSPEFAFMLRSIYGGNMTIARLFERWEAWAIVEGIGKEGFSRDEVMVVEAAPLENNVESVK